MSVETQNHALKTAAKGTLLISGTLLAGSLTYVKMSQKLFPTTRPLLRLVKH